MAISNNYLQSSPLSAFQQGFGFNDNLMQQILGRNQLAQHGELANAQMAQQKAMSDARLAQQLREHLDQLSIQKQQQARLNELHPLHRRLLEAQMQKQLADAEKAKMWSQLLGGGNPNSSMGGMQSPPELNQLSGQSNSAMGNTGTEQQLDNNHMQNLNQSSQIGKEQELNPGNPQRYGLDQVAGLPGMPKVQIQMDKDGNLYKIFPSGKVTKAQVGANAGELAESKEIGKYQGLTYGKAVDASQSLGEQQGNLERLVSNLENQPNASQIIGPMNKYMTQLFGNPEDKALLGDVMATTGNIVLDAAKNIKGAFTGRDQSLINSMKPNANDPYFVFLGKLKGMGELNQMAQHRADIYADLLHQGMAPHRALKMAQEQTKIEPVTDKYHALLKNARQKSDLSEGKMPTFETKEEAQQFLRGLSPQEKIKLMQQVGGK